MRTRFVKSRQEIDGFARIYAAPSFLDIRTLRIPFETDPEVIAEIIPPPLEPADRPSVSIAVSEIGRSNCVGAFNGCTVNIACTYQGEPGQYCLMMPMTTDTAVLFGRELFAEPKKLADITLAEVRPNQFVGTVTRHGITFIELTGTFDGPPRPVDAGGTSYHYYFKHLPAADGHGLAFDPQLVRVTHRGQTRELARGRGTITLRDSVHDPIADLPVFSAGEATLSVGETHTSAEVVATVPAEQYLPYSFANMDDLFVWADGEVLALPDRIQGAALAR